MTSEESKRLTKLLMHRSKDFWTTEDGEFDPKAWRRYLKKINVRMIEDDDLCEAYNNKEDDTVLVENPHMGLVWMILPRDLAFKSLVLGEMPPRYSKKQPVRG